MDLLFLGTGSAFTTLNYQTNILVRTDEGNLLIDAGSDIRFSLRDQGLTYRDVDAIYISHQHADHIGGMEYLGFCRFFDPGCTTPKLYGGPLIDRLWDEYLKLGMEVLTNQSGDMVEYFEIQETESGSFHFGGYLFEMIMVPHIMTGELVMMESYGLRISGPGIPKIFITTDTVFYPKLLCPHYEWADVIFHDCEVGDRRSGVHPHLSDLLKLPEYIRCKMYLVHYPDLVLVNLPDFEFFAMTEKFRGFIPKGFVYHAR